MYISFIFPLQHHYAAVITMSILHSFLKTPASSWRDRCVRLCETKWMYCAQQSWQCRTGSCTPRCSIAHANIATVAVAIRSDGTHIYMNLKLKALHSMSAAEGYHFYSIVVFKISQWRRWPIRKHVECFLDNAQCTQSAMNLICTNTNKWPRKWMQNLLCFWW